MILETAVECTRVCRDQRVQQGVTTQRASARKKEQRSWARWAWCNQVHSVASRAAKVEKDKKSSINEVNAMLISGQLLFLG